jgi:hypothetical protein
LGKINSSNLSIIFVNKNNDGNTLEASGELRAWQLHRCHATTVLLEQGAHSIVIILSKSSKTTLKGCDASDEIREEGENFLTPKTVPRKPFSLSAQQDIPYQKPTFLYDALNEGGIPK